MPRLTPTAESETRTVQFVASPSLDLMNALYFTGLVPETEGVEGWPVVLRREMAPDLLNELDSLFDYPAGDPGLIGTLTDNLIAHPETWRDIDALTSYVDSMPDGIGDLDLHPGVQGLIYQAVFRYPDDIDRTAYERLPHREAIEARLRSLGDRDVDAIMAQFDRPSELRQRMVALIQRFFTAHYRNEMAHRLPALERSVASHRAEHLSDAEAIARRLTGKQKSCLEAGCAGPYEAHIFVPSIDMGVYNSCAIVDGVHGLYYHLEPEYRGAAPDEADETRLARIYKALSDEQRLRILRLLREREMYAQEIVERTGIHQSVVSRHLSFMKAVGLVLPRRENNMKFYSLNSEIREQLTKTLDLFAPSWTD